MAKTKLTLPKNKQETVRLLRHWAKIVERRADDKFDMTNWCGTACCAAGVAALDPKFRERGFYKRFRTDWMGQRRAYLNEYDLKEVLGVTFQQLDAIVYDTGASKAKIVRKINKLADKVEASIK